jgi:hypothetical protein
VRVNKKKYYWVDRGEQSLLYRITDQELVIYRDPKNLPIQSLKLDECRAVYHEKAKHPYFYQGIVLFLVGVFAVVLMVYLGVELDNDLLGYACCASAVGPVLIVYALRQNVSKLFLHTPTKRIEIQGDSNDSTWRAFVGAVMSKSPGSNTVS